MTIGLGVFTPSAKFTILRSYLFDLRVFRAGDSLTQADNVFTIHAVPPDATFAVFVINPRLWLWNTNAYTLDFIVTESYYKVGGVGSEVPLPFQIDYQILSTTKRPTISYSFFGQVTDPQTISLPPAAPHYWLPKPLP